MSGRIARYSAYAIGEIILVVLGILIALSINNWNEERLVRAQEKEYLQSLHEEYSNNLEVLDQSLRRNARHIASAKVLLENTGPEAPLISQADFANHFRDVFGSEMHYRPATGVLTEVISSGKLEIFPVSIRRQLASWDGLMLRIRFQEGEHAVPRLNAFDLAYKEGNMRQLVYFMFDELNADVSNFPNSNLDLLQNVEFENYLSTFLITAELLDLNYYSPVKASIQETIANIDTRLAELED